MEALLGRKVKITFDRTTSGMIVATGELVRIAPPFLVLATANGELYCSIHSIKTVEAEPGRRP